MKDTTKTMKKFYGRQLKRNFKTYFEWKHHAWCLTVLPDAVDCY